MLLDIQETFETLKPQWSWAMGLDFGTTFSSLSLVLPSCEKDGLYRAQPQMITPLVPTVVAYDKNSDHLWCGAEAVEKQHIPWCYTVISSVKRWLCTPQALAPQTAWQGRAPFHVAVDFLRHMHALACQGVQRYHLSPLQNTQALPIVLTVPAYFDECARGLVKRAAQEAGFHILRLLTEPVAAALSYGLHIQKELAGAHTLVQDVGGEVYGVYDVGGGTFDISFLMLTQDTAHVMATGGHAAMGGDDLDRTLADDIAACVERENLGAPWGKISRSDTVSVSLLENNACRLQPLARLIKETLWEKDIPFSTWWSMAKACGGENALTAWIKKYATDEFCGTQSTDKNTDQDTVQGNNIKKSDELAPLEGVACEIEKDLIRQEKIATCHDVFFAPCDTTPEDDKKSEPLSCYSKAHHDMRPFHTTELIHNIHIASLRRHTIQLWMPFFQKTWRIVEKTLQDLYFTTENLRGMVMVGGSCALRPLQAFLQKQLGSGTPLIFGDFHRAVALGAGLHAYHLTHETSFLLLDVTPLSLGVEIQHGLVQRLIPRNHPLPAEGEMTFTTAVDGQRAMRIHVVQGEQELAKNCRSLGVFTLEDLPPTMRGRGRVTIRFSLNQEGLLTVCARCDGENREEFSEKTPAPSLEKVVHMNAVSALDDASVAYMLRQEGEDLAQRLWIQKATDMRQALDEVRTILTTLQNQYDQMNVCKVPAVLEKENDGPGSYLCPQKAVPCFREAPATPSFDGPEYTEVTAFSAETLGAHYGFSLLADIMPGTFLYNAAKEACLMLEDVLKSQDLSLAEKTWEHFTRVTLPFIETYLAHTLKALGSWRPGV